MGMKYLAVYRYLAAYGFSPAKASAQCLLIGGITNDTTGDNHGPAHCERGNRTRRAISGGAVGVGGARGAQGRQS